MKKTSIILVLCVLFANTSFGQVHEYKIEKGQIDYVTETISGTNETVVYFKDYGSVELVVFKKVFFSAKKTTKILIKGNYVYKLNVEKKTGTKTTIGNYFKKSDLTNLDYNNIPKGIKEKYKIKYLGTEIIVGKECKMFSRESPNGRKTTEWVWKNIVLKKRYYTDFGDDEMAAKKINTNPNFPSGTFEVPTNYTITEVD